MNGVVEVLAGLLAVQHGSAALIAVLGVVLVVSVATVCVCGWLEWHTEAVQRSRRSQAVLAEIARRKGGCAVRLDEWK